MARPISSYEKLLSAFKLFSLERAEWTVEEAALELDLAVSTTYRYFRSLSEAGLIVAFSAGRYVLGPAIIQLDRQTRLLDPLIRTAQPIMQRVARDLDVSGVLLLCRLYRDQVMCVHQELIGSPGTAVSYERGRPMPLHRGAASKIIIANLPARIVRSYYDKHATDMAAVSLGETWDEVKRNLRKTRLAKNSITHGELDNGMTGIAAAIFDPASDIIGSIGMVGHDVDFTSAVLTSLAERLHVAADEITHGLARLADTAPTSERDRRLGVSNVVETARASDAGGGEC
ncbi:MAG: IclR family transcriptional regulator [Alphaproteobacteria bacterium]